MSESLILSLVTALLSFFGATKAGLPKAAAAGIAATVGVGTYAIAKKSGLDGKWWGKPNTEAAGSTDKVLDESTGSPDTAATDVQGQRTVKEGNSDTSKWGETIVAGIGATTAGAANIVQAAGGAEGIAKGYGIGRGAKTFFDGLKNGDTKSMLIAGAAVLGLILVLK